MTNTIISFLEYLFGFSPSQHFGLQWAVWVFVVLALAGALYIYFKAKKSANTLLRKILMEYPGKFITIAALLIINLLSRDYGIEVLSMRFITYLLLLWLVYAAYMVYRDLTVTYPNRLAQQKQKFISLEEKYKIHKNKSRKKSKKR